MDFSKKSLKQEVYDSKTKKNKKSVRIIMLIFKSVLAVALIFLIVGGAFLIGSVNGVINGSPNISIEEVQPKGLSSVIYDTDKNEIQTLTGSGANRTLVEYSDIPASLVNAFVAIEDERFWEHDGIDIKGIFRAGYVALSSGFSFTEGASTITQQLIKNNVFDGGLEKTVGARFVRKIQEQSMALELEKTASKEDIMKNYLNTINLGANCLGVEKAAERYFDKSVSDLTISECAVIAAITQNPYAYNPITFPEQNAERRAVVLKKMEEQGYITTAEKEEALADDVYSRIAEVDTKYQNTNQEVYSYFVDRLVSDIVRDLQEAGYSYAKATSLLYSGGLSIYSTQDSSIQKIVDEEVNDESNYSSIVNKYSFSYSMRVVHSDGTHVDYGTNDVWTYSGKTYIDFSSKSEIYSLIESFKSAHCSESDEITIDNLSITLQPQASVTVMDQSTGEVKAICGGRGEKETSLSLNRATNTFRQPGSTFKVLASFAPALEYGNCTLATTFYDEPYTYNHNGVTWTPKNWYSSNIWAGYSNIHQGITYSMNIVAAKCLVDKVGEDAAYNMVELFGINTLIPETAENKKSGLNDVNPTIALGGITQGVTNMQLTGAYAAIANEGTYTEPILYTKIVDSNGKTIIDNTPDTHYVISKENAYLLTKAMQSSMESSTLNGLVGSTSTSAKPDKMIAAGKSGTTDNSNDLWFVGFSKYYTIGIWSGFDDNNKFSASESTSYHKAIWKQIMDRISVNLPVVDFTQPSDITTCEICTKSGKLASDACRNDHRESIVTTEYFIKGTEPTEYCDIHSYCVVCAESGLLPNLFCTHTTTRGIIKLPEGSTSYTQDSQYSGAPSSYCNICPITTTSEGESGANINGTGTGTGTGGTTNNQRNNTGGTTSGGTGTSGTGTGTGTGGNTTR